MPLRSQQQQFGGQFESLEPGQQALVRKWGAEASQIFRRPMNGVALYNKLPLSARTTFEAVTHALSRSRLTSGTGKPMGTALDLVDLVERVAGQVQGARGDSQFRVYVYLKPDAVDKLYNCREFKRVHDNTVFHIGYPINFRQSGGVPSIQISVARTGRRADIDVDYRPSGGIQALTSGHLTSANSDVRAGDNHRRHVGRWQGFPDWWRGFMAALAGPLDLLEVVDFSPESQPELDKAARGPLPEMLKFYLEEWLLRQRPSRLLEAISIKAYPCVAEFVDGSRPDSKLALMRILNQLESENRRMGKVRSLEDALAPIAYPLPEAQPVSHAYSTLFSLQRVHDDTAWAIDCRVRYGLHLAESIPRPEHKLEDSFVASFRLRGKGNPGFLVQTWQKEAGEWRLVSFDIKRKHLAPPADLRVRAARPPGMKEAEPALRSAMDTFLQTWLLERRFEKAAAAFLPEAAACDPLGDLVDPAKPADPKKIHNFLSETAEAVSREGEIEKVISAAQAGHPELKILEHDKQGAYLLAEAGPKLLEANSCSAAAAVQAKDAGAFSAFHFSHSKQQSSGAFRFFWRKVNGEWRIASYALSAD
jgi:hypothetical protein